MIEEGITVFITLFGIYRDEKYFENPIEFNASRFDKSNSKGKNRINWSHDAFGDGPCVCFCNEKCTVIHQVQIEYIQYF